MEVPERKVIKKPRNRRLKTKKTSEIGQDQDNEIRKEVFLESEQMVEFTEDQQKCGKEVVEDLHQKLNTANEELVNKTDQINDMNQTIIDLQDEIKSLEEQVKEQNLKLLSLEKDNEWLKANSAGDKDISFQLVDPDKSLKDKVANDYLVKTVKEKNEIIEKLTKKINNLQDKLNKISSNQCLEGKNQESKLKEFLAKINKRTGNRFRTIDECFEFIETKSDDLQRKSSRDDSGSNFGSGKLKQFSEELNSEDFKDQIYKLEYKMKLQENKFKNELKEKEAEIEDLNEEIEAMKKTKSKEKAQMKGLKEKIDELESDLELKTDEISSNDKKMKNLIQKDKDANLKFERLEQKVEQHQQDNKRLNEELSSVKKMLEEARECKKAKEELSTIVNKKQGALDIMKKKIEDYQIQTNQLTNEKNVLQKDLKDIKDAQRLKIAEMQTKNMEQVKKIAYQEAKIIQMENEIEQVRINKYNEFEFRPRPVPKPNGFVREDPPSIVNENMKKIACPNCHMLCESTEIQAHVNVCLDDGR